MRGVKLRNKKFKKSVTLLNIHASIQRLQSILTILLSLTPQFPIPRYPIPLRFTARCRLTGEFPVDDGLRLVDVDAVVRLRAGQSQLRDTPLPASAGVAEEVVTGRDGLVPGTEQV